MPKYELLYIIGADTADDAVPTVIAEVKAAIAGAGGKIEKHEEWGRRKLAYPIKHTKIGYYVLDNFDAPGERANEIEHRIRTNQAIIRHLVANMDEAYERMEKDRRVQSLMKPRRPKEPEPVKTATTAPARPRPTIDLDAEIEKAIGSNN